MSVSVSYFALPSDMETVDTLDGFRRTLVPERWAHPGEGRPETAGLVGGNPDAIVMYTNLVKGDLGFESSSNRIFRNRKKNSSRGMGYWVIYKSRQIMICHPFFHEQKRGQLGIIHYNNVLNYLLF